MTMQSEDEKPAVPSKGRVTIREIAKEVGLHFTTVARALKDSDLVRPSTRKRVREAADRLGYQVDPFVSAFCSYRSRHLKKGYRGNLSWINGFDSPDYFENEAQGYYKECYEGARQRSEDLGYKLASFWYGEPGMSAKRASQIIHSRGEAGLIVAPMPPDVQRMEMRWDSFCSVQIGYSIPGAPVANVVSDHFGNMKLLCDRLERLGFSRIGFATRGWIDERVERKWSGAFEVRRYGESASRYLPVFLGESEDDFSAFKRWIEEQRPSVLILAGDTPYASYVERLGLSVPEAIQLVSVSLESVDFGRLAGIDQQARVVGAVAVDLLTGAIGRSQVGVESYPKTIMTGGVWRGCGSGDFSSPIP